MKKTIRILIMIPFIVTTAIFGQTKGDYVVTLNKDTVSINLIKWNNTRIKCTANGKETKFKAKDILSYYIDSTMGETGKICPTLIGFKKWMFLDKTVSGKISLFQVSALERSLDSRDFNSPTGYSHTYSSVTIWYVRKYDEPQRKYHKIMGYGLLPSLMSDCPKALERMNSKDHGWTPVEDVKFYNANCTNK